MATAALTMSEAFNQLCFQRDHWRVAPYLAITPVEATTTLEDDTVVFDGINVIRLAEKVEMLPGGAFSVKVKRKWGKRLSFAEFQKLIENGPRLINEMRNNFHSRLGYVHAFNLSEFQRLVEKGGFLLEQMRNSVVSYADPNIYNIRSDLVRKAKAKHFYELTSDE